MSVLAATGIVQRANGRTILSAPAFEVEPAEHLLLLGPSGSGKTTLINILAGLATPAAGTVTILGKSFSSLGSAARDAMRRQHIGLIFQTLRLISAISVRQNLALAQHLSLGRVDRQWIDRLISEVGLTHRADAKPRTLSQGEGQRAAIARALCTNPKILIADEPTSALDADNAHRVIDLFMASADRVGASLVIATHDDRIRGRFPRTLELIAPSDDGR